MSKPNIGREVLKIFSPILRLYDHDKTLLVGLLLKKGVAKTEIAKTLGVTPSAISHYLRRKGLK